MKDPDMSPPDAPFGLRWQDHLGLITAVVLTTATVVNIAAAGDWNPQVALALLRSMGTVSVMTASLISLMPNILSGATSAGSAYVLYGLITKNTHSQQFLGITGITLCLLVLSFFVPSVVLWAIVVLGFLGGLFFAVADRGKGDEARQASVRRFLAFFLLTPVASFSLQGGTWFPPENLTFADPSRNTSAYVSKMTNLHYSQLELGG
jgi:hypothetical protein